MSAILKGHNVYPLQRKRFMSLEGYVFGALQINSNDVGTIENLIELVNDVYEADITYSGKINAAIDEVWGYVSGLSKAQRKKLRHKNILKVRYPMKGAMGAKRRAKLTRIKFYSEAATEDRAKRDRKILEDTRQKSEPIGKRAAIRLSAKEDREEFYKSWKWRTLRMEVIKEFGRECQCCGATPGMKDAVGNPVRIVVDHIKPISKYWGMRLDRKNLQILCDECNQGKGNWDETDFRPQYEEADDQIDGALIEQLTDRTIGRMLQ